MSQITQRALRLSTAAIFSFNTAVVPITTATAVGAIFSLSACASGGTTVNTIVSEMTAVMSGLTKLLPVLHNLIPATTYNQVTGWIADAQAALAAITSGSGGDAAQQFVHAVTAILGVVATLGVLASPWSEIAAAIAALLPVIASLLGVSVPQQARASHWRPMSTAEAMSILTAK